MMLRYYYGMSQEEIDSMTDQEYYDTLYILLEIRKQESGKQRNNQP